MAQLTVAAQLPPPVTVTVAARANVVAGDKWPAGPLLKSASWLLKLRVQDLFPDGYRRASMTAESSKTTGHSANRIEKTAKTSLRCRHCLTCAMCAMCACAIEWAKAACYNHPILPEPRFRIAALFQSIYNFFTLNIVYELSIASNHRDSAAHRRTWQPGWRIRQDMQEQYAAYRLPT